MADLHAALRSCSARRRSLSSSRAVQGSGRWRHFVAAAVSARRQQRAEQCGGQCHAQASSNGRRQDQHRFQLTCVEVRATGVQLSQKSSDAFVLLPRTRTPSSSRSSRRRHVEQRLDLGGFGAGSSSSARSAASREVATGSGLANLAREPVQPVHETPTRRAAVDRIGPGRPQRLLARRAAAPRLHSMPPRQGPVVLRPLPAPAAAIGQQARPER